MSVSDCVCIARTMSGWLCPVFVMQAIAWKSRYSRPSTSQKDAPRPRSTTIDTNGRRVAGDRYCLSRSSKCAVLDGCSLTLRLDGRSNLCSRPAELVREEANILVCEIGFVLLGAQEIRRAKCVQVYVLHREASERLWKYDPLTRPVLASVSA